MILSLFVFALFLILKLTSVVHWSWWAVTASLWVFGVIALSYLFLRRALRAMVDLVINTVQYGMGRLKI